MSDFSCVAPVVNCRAAKKLVKLAMSNDELSETVGLFHCLFHHFIALNAHSVIRKGDHIWRQLLHIGKLPLLFALCDAAIWINTHLRVALYYVSLRFQVFKRVRHRVKVRHGANTRKPAVRRSKCSAFYRFLIKKTRLSKMNMNINETGKNKAIIKIKNRNALQNGGKGVRNT